jgi:glucosylceramidase
MEIRKMIAAAAIAFAGVLAQAVEIEMFQTTEKRPFRQIKNIVPFSPHCAAAVPVLDLDAAKVSHEFKGLGVSFAEASCRLLSELPGERRREFLEMVFSRKGAGVTMGRIHVGCSDYSAHIYTYDDVMDDMELKHFSIDPDRKYVIPVIKEAQKICPELYFFGSVWTPPAWMKLGRERCGGWIDIEKLPVFCDYYVKFLQEYAKEGIVVSAISAQNEPYSDQNGESNGGFVAVHMMNALNTGGFSIQSANKGKGEFAFEFTGHYSLEDQSKVPFEVYVKTGSEE